MKEIKYLLIVLATLTVVSCNDWLDVEPTSQLDRGDLLSSENGYADALTGVYANMSKASLYGREMTWGMLDVLVGQYFPGAGISGNYSYLTNYQYKRGASGFKPGATIKIDSVWSCMYTQIANLNSLLETIDGNKTVFSGDNYNIIKGEAIGLRAFLHFELLRMFGESYATGKDVAAIPYVTELSTMVAPLLTVDQALTRIIDDLKTAKELLKNDPMRLNVAPSGVLAPLPADKDYTLYNIPEWHNRRFSFNYYAATATLARAYLWKGDEVNQANALTEAREVIAVQETHFPWVDGMNLNTIGSDQKNQDATFATEHVFAMNIKDIENYMSGYCYFGENNSSTQAKLSPWAYYKYVYPPIFESNDDFRKQYLIFNYNGYGYCRKYYQESNVYSFFRERVPLIRISEMYYIVAECTTDLNEARKALETVRFHRGLGSSPLDENITRSALDQEIQKEYRKEFIAEGQFWFYCKRKNVDLKTMDNYNFKDNSLYTFDRPDAEDGNRVL